MATRDYSKKPRPKAAEGGKGGQLPGWVWMLAGLLVGLFVAFLVYLNQVAPERSAAAPAAAPAPKKPAETHTAKAAPPQERSGISYDFYKILPEYEVVVPEEDLKKPEVLQQEMAATGRYYVQAGSFRSAADADTRKAELAILGLVSDIQTVTVDDGKSQSTWHRVRIGPIGAQKDLDRVRRLLQDNRIGFILLKEKS